MLSFLHERTVGNKKSGVPCNRPLVYVESTWQCIEDQSYSNHEYTCISTCIHMLMMVTWLIHWVQVVDVMYDRDSTPVIQSENTAVIIINYNWSWFLTFILSLFSFDSLWWWQLMIRWTIPPHSVILLMTQEPFIIIILSLPLL